MGQIGKKQLASSLEFAGHPPFTLSSQEGASILVLPYGARVLGLFPKDAPNLLWTHPDLEKEKTAEQFFKTPGWRNTGGGRTWISPERDIHVADLQDPWNSYTVTGSVDPGNFTVEATKDQICLKTSGPVIHYRSGARCSVHLEKTVRMVPNPLRYLPHAADLLNGIRYAGIEQITSLRSSEASGGSPLQLSLWDAVNLPATGTILIPTVHPVQPADFFEPTGPSHLRSTSSGLSFLFDGLQRHKISVRVTEIASGRAGYLRQTAPGTFSLLVRNFFVDPSAVYVDTPWNNPNDRGHVLQCYNDGGVNGLYGELEYHSPAMGPETGRSECLDRAQLWGFEGPREAILTIAAQLLGQAIIRELVD